MRGLWTLIAIAISGCTTTPLPEFSVEHCPQGLGDPIAGESISGIRYSSFNDEPTPEVPTNQEIEVARKKISAIVSGFLAEKYSDPGLRQFDSYTSNWVLVSDQDGVRLYGLHMRRRFEPLILISDGGSGVICSWHDRKSGEVLAVKVHPNA